MKPPTAATAPYAPGALVPAATRAAQAGPPHVQEPTDYDAVLLVGFGGPEGPSDVMPFLRNVTAGRGIPDERLAQVAQHYQAFDGVSPINEQNRALRAALAEELLRTGPALPVLWGNRNFAPYLTDALQQAHADGHRRLLALATSAYSCYSSCRQYREDLANALAATGLAGELQVDKIRPFFDHPGFIGPFVGGTDAALRDVAAAGARRVEVLFTTHSIPAADANFSGPSGHEFGEGGAYAAQHRGVAQAVIAGLSVPDGVEIAWQLVYQSRSGPPSQPWLEPDINDAIKALDQCTDAVLIVPIGFVSDHLEVAWDLDNEAIRSAAERGLRAVRVATPGVDPQFVSGLADLVRERTEGRPACERAAATDLGPWFDVCRPGCCAHGRRPFAPALGGLAP